MHIIFHGREKTQSKLIKKNQGLSAVYDHDNQNILWRARLTLS